jgi:hypothetical protein
MRRTLNNKKRDVQIKVKTVTVPTLTYGPEIWGTTTRQDETIETAECSRLHKEEANKER